MNDVKAKAIAAQLLANAAGLRYGSVSVSAKLHDGRVVEVTYSKTEQTREPAAERVLTSEGSPPVRGSKKGNEE
jgi:hypothetical protein